MYQLFEQIAELRIRGGQTEADHEHVKLEIASMVEDLEETKDKLDERFGDCCNHGEHLKYVMTEGGIFCQRCGEEVNEYPKDPEVFTL
jgi:hypothetical protein